jgi:ribulose-phosphate 3-epimerase
MTEYPEQIAELWLQAGARRIIVHAETLVDSAGLVRHLEDGDVVDYLLQLCEAYEATCMLSSNPETPLHSIESFLRRFQEFQVLCVTPGFSGQHFLPLTLGKISFLRSIRSHAWIEVDGGMNTETAVSALSAGASALVSSSFIFSHTNPGIAYRMLCDVRPDISSSTSYAVVKKSHTVQSKRQSGRNRSRSST